MPVQILYTPTSAGAELVTALRPLGTWERKHHDILDAEPE